MEILLRLLGGGPSLSVLAPESIPSGVGLPVCEVDCEEGGEGRYTPVNCERGGNISGGGDGELAGEDRGEESTLDGGEESGLLGPETVEAAIVGRRMRRSGAQLQCVSAEKES